jgi:hypothetical protein
MRVDLLAMFADQVKDATRLLVPLHNQYAQPMMDKETLRFL